MAKNEDASLLHAAKVKSLKDVSYQKPGVADVISQSFPPAHLIEGVKNVSWHDIKTVAQHLRRQTPCMVSYLGITKEKSPAPLLTSKKDFA